MINLVCCFSHRDPPICLNYSEFYLDLQWLDEFLSSSEFTVPSLLPFSSGVYFSLTDITIDSCESPTCVCIRLKVSKTDPYRKGCFIGTGKGLNPLCVIQTLVAYLTITGTRKAPFSSFVTVILSCTYNGYVRCWG